MNNPSIKRISSSPSRWTGTDALDAGIVQATSSFEELPELAVKKAEELAPLATDRKNFGYQKEMLFGENAAINLNHGHD